MSAEEQAFLARITEDPFDDLTRAVYADWLQERGDRRGDYLRAEIALAAREEHEEGYAEEEAELIRLREGLDPEWVEHAGKRYDVVLYDCPDGWKVSTVLRLREMTALGIAELKGIVWLTPSLLHGSVSRPAAERMQNEILKGPQRIGRGRLCVEVRVIPCSAEQHYRSRLTSAGTAGPAPPS